MQAYVIYRFGYKWTWFYLAMLLGISHKGSATVLDTKVASSQKTRHPSQEVSNQLLTPNNQRTQVYSSAISDTGRLQLLKPIARTPPSPLVRVDACLVQYPIQYTPYVPLVQAIDIACDYGGLVMTLCTQVAHQYAGRLHILFRYNIQLLGIWGHQKYTQSKVLGNQSGYTSSGHYGGIGLAYFIPYNQRNNLYTGMHYGRSIFINCSESTASTGSGVSEELSANWWELVIGSEHQLFNNLGFYAGLVIHLKSCFRCDPFAPATNHVIPGYGRSVQRMAPALTLYIAYKISFLKKQITFK